MKWLLSVFMVLSVVVPLTADSVYDRTITVIDKSRNEKSKEVFRDLIAAYVDEDARTFFDGVSEDRFIQDYITFSDAVYNDFRLYDIMQVDYWFEGVIPFQQVGRIVTVRWEERYESLESSEQFERRGLSRFTFDEVDGEYYLIQVEGNPLFGISSPEWTEEVPPIAGQERENEPTPETPVFLADVTPENIRCVQGQSSGGDIAFDIKNIGPAQAAGAVLYSIDNGTPQIVEVLLDAGEIKSIYNAGFCPGGTVITVTLEPQFDDADSSNNTASSQP